MLLKKVDLLESQTQHYKELVLNMEKQDVAKDSIINWTNTYWENNTIQLKSELKKTSKQKNLYKVGMIGTIVSAIAALIFLK